MWEENAKIVEQVYGGYVDWEERFYICPECDEPVYEDDWTDHHFRYFLCPICEFEGENKEPAPLTAAGRFYKIKDKENSPTGIYWVSYGEYDNETKYYFSSYERAVQAMQAIIHNKEWDENFQGPYPLVLDDDNKYIFSQGE